MKKIINGIEYESKPEHNHSSCDGCVASEVHNGLCSELSYGESCSANRIIWFKKTTPPSKFTVIEVIEAITELNPDYQISVEDTTKHLMKKQIQNILNICD
jgi:hypothetical protein